MKKLLAGTAVAVLVCGIGATTAQAKPDNTKPNNIAAKICQAEKHADAAAFQATYADEGEHAMRNCKRAHRAEATGIVDTATAACTAEQAADPVVFETTYGGKGGDNKAFRNCVSVKVNEALAAAA
jgi:hypothetical protein